MNKDTAAKVINELLTNLEEEEIGISLLSNHYTDEEQLLFFNEADRCRVLYILKRLADDSLRHKEMLKKIVALLEEELV